VYKEKGKVIKNDLNEEMKRQVAIFLCDRTGNMGRPWAEAGFMCICVDLHRDNSIRATARGKHRVEKVGAGEIHFVWGDARSWKPSQFDRHFFSKYEIVFVGAFPVCTNLCGSGAQDWPLKGLAMLCDGLMLFNACELAADWSGAPWCVENPVGTIPTHHRKPDYYFQPWFYGDLYQKKTCLWTGNGFVMPRAEFIVKPEGVKQSIWLASPGEDRADIRSETPEGFARAVFEANYKQPLKRAI
jgi:hypothetical protein